MTQSATFFSLLETDHSCPTEQRLGAAEYCRQQNIKYNAFYYWQRKIREDFAASALQIPKKDAPAPEFAMLTTATVTATVQTATLPSMLKLSCSPMSLEVAVTFII